MLFQIELNTSSLFLFTFACLVVWLVIAFLPFPRLSFSPKSSSRLDPRLSAPHGPSPPFIGAEAAIHTHPAGPHTLEITWLRTLRTAVLTYPSLLGSRVLFLADPLAAAHAAALEMTPLESSIARLLLGERGIITAGAGAEEHRRMRRALGPAFSSSSIAALGPLMQRHALGLVEAIKGVCPPSTSGTASNSIDVVPWINAAAFDILADAALGYQSRCVEHLRNGSKGSKDPLAAAFDRTNAAFASQSPLTQVFFSLLGVLVTPLANSSLFARNRAIKTNRARMEKLALDLISKRLGSHGEQNDRPIDDDGAPLDIVSRLLSQRQGGKGKDEQHKNVLVGQINAFLFAGHETTSSALSWLLHALATHQAFQAKLAAELTELDDLSTAARHPLVEATVRESLRLFPPARVLRRVVSQEGGVVLPLSEPVEAVGKELVLSQGQNIVIGLAAMNRSQSIWGHDADEFRPERWLEPRPPSHTHAHLPYDLASFGFGPKTCLGARLALLELQTLTACLVQHFHFAPASASASASAPGLGRGDEEVRRRPRIVSRQALFFRPVVEGEEARGSQLPLSIAFR